MGPQQGRKVFTLQTLPALIADIRPAEVDALAVRSFLASRARAGAGKRTQARSLSALRGLFKFACREGTLASNPAATVTKAARPI